MEIKRGNESVGGGVETHETPRDGAVTFNGMGNWWSWLLEQSNALDVVKEIGNSLFAAPTDDGGSSALRIDMSADGTD